MAISHATYILKTSEQLQEDEHPAAWKWAFADELEAHFERVKTKREAKFGGGKSSQEPDEPSGGWQENEYARNLR